MADVFTAADSVRAYLTGAGGDAVYQGDPAASLGLYRSTVIAESLTIRRVYPIPGIVIVFAAGWCGVGNGVLTASGPSALEWTPPGGTIGAAVTIANGETKQIPGGDASAYLVVTRISASDLTGTETVVLMDSYGSVAGSRDYTSAEAAAGEEIYRAVMFYNGSGSSITGLTVWLDSTYAGHTLLAAEAPIANALTDETVNGELIQPAGLSWSGPTSEGAGIVIGTLAAAAMYGLWLEEFITAGAVASARVRSAIRWTFTSGATKYYGSLRGLHRIANDALERWEEYKGTDALPDLDGSPVVTGSASPLTAYALVAGHTYYLKLAKKNKYGLMDRVMNPETVIIAADGSRTADRPSGPTAVTVSAGPAGVIRVAAQYTPFRDSAVATYWLIYLKSDGTANDLVNDTPIEQAMDTGTWLNSLAYTSAALIDLAPVQVVVRTRRKDTGLNSVTSITRSATTATVTAAGHGYVTGMSITIAGANEAAYNGAYTITVVDADTFTYTVAGSPATPATGTITAQYTTALNVDSDNTAVASVTADYCGPSRVSGQAAYGRAAGIFVAPDAWAGNVTTWIDQAKNIYWLQKSGELQLWFDTVLGFRCRYSSAGPAALDMFGTHWELYETVSVSGAGSAAAVEILSWTGGDRRVTINVNSVRRMLFDVTNLRISFLAGDQVTAVQQSCDSAPAHLAFPATLLQVWDPAEQTWVTPLAEQSDGTFRHEVDWKQYATQAAVLAA